MDENTEALAKSILNGRMPSNWKSKSYPSLKSLANYITDLKLRIEFWQVKKCVYFRNSQNETTYRATGAMIYRLNKLFCSTDLATAEPNASSRMDTGIFLTARISGVNSVELFTSK